MIDFFDDLAETMINAGMWIDHYPVVYAVTILHDRCLKKTSSDFSAVFDNVPRCPEFSLRGLLPGMAYHASREDSEGGTTIILRIKPADLPAHRLLGPSISIAL